MFKVMTKSKARHPIKNKLETIAFDYLTENKIKHKNVKKLHNYSLKMAEHLEPNNLHIKLRESKLLFQLKRRMVNVKANYSSSHKQT